MKALNPYLEKRKSAILLLLQKPQHSFTPDTFHTLRLEIKKLHALFDLVHFCSKEFKQKNTFKPFQLIFRQAGKVRELQVEAAMLEPYFCFNLPEYNEHLKKELATALAHFFLLINPELDLTLKKKYRKIIPFLTQISKKEAQRYLDKKRVKIEKLLHQNTLKNKQLHLLRKRLKELQYNESILNDAKQNTLPPNKDLLPELLGAWHDYQVTITHLKKGIHSGALQPTETNTLENIIATFTHHRQLLLTKINAGLPNRNGLNNSSPQ
jgi:CHAD domain-containing protein